MNTYKHIIKTLGLILVTGTVLSGCGAGPSSPGRYYVLSSPTELLAAKRPPGNNQSLRLGIGPISLPAHLDRTQIVTQASPNRISLQVLDQWAEPLKGGFSRILSANLSSLLQTDDVFQYPWRRPITVEYQVTVEVLRFNTDSNGESALSVRWNVIRGDGEELLFSHTSVFKSRVSDKGIEATVAAMSHNLAELSREIGTSIAALNH